MKGDLIRVMRLPQEPAHQIEAILSWTDNFQPLTVGCRWNRSYRVTVNSGTEKLRAAQLMGGKQVEQQARQLLFWNFFLFGKEKSGTFPLYKRNFCENLVCSLKRNTLFVSKILRVEKILYHSLYLKNLRTEPKTLSSSYFYLKNLTAPRNIPMS